MPGKARTPWHPLFAALLEERKPSGFELQVEVTLSNEPQRADLLLLRRTGDDSDGRVLRGLWRRLAGLDPHAALLALPDDALRALPKAYIDGLPDDIRTKVEARLADAD